MTMRQGAMEASPKVSRSGAQAANASSRATRPDATALPSDPAAANTDRGCDRRLEGKTFEIIEFAAGPSEASPTDSSSRARQRVQNPMARPLAMVIRLQPTRLMTMRYLRLT